MGVILAVIAVKLGGETFGLELLSPVQSLAVVLGLLAAGVGASLLDTSGDKIGGLADKDSS